MKNTLQTYLKNLEAGDFAALMDLFAEDALVHSPLYGEMTAREFFRQLFRDTDHSVITPLHTFTDEAVRKGAIYFLYEWVLDNGQHTSFHCVDIADFDEQGKIKMLKIVYDTSQSRAALELQRRG